MATIEMTTIEKIEMQRQKRKLSRRQLARKAGLKPSTLQSVIERNRGISVAMLVKIAEALECSAYELMGEVM